MEKGDDKFNDAGPSTSSDTSSEQQQRRRVSVRGESRSLARPYTRQADILANYQNYGMAYHGWIDYFLYSSLQQ